MQHELTFLQTAQGKVARDDSRSIFEGGGGGGCIDAGPAVSGAGTAGSGEEPGGGWSKVASQLANS